MSPDVVFCSPSATRFNVLSIQRCCSAYFVMHGYLSYCCLPINLKQSGHFVLATTWSQHCNNTESCHSLDILLFFQNILCKPRRRLGGEMPMWKWITMKYSCENGNRMQELQLTDHNWPFIRNIQTYKEIIWPQKSLNSLYGNNSRDWRQPPAAVLEANKELKIYTKYSR